jgi:gluconate kinase
MEKRSGHFMQLALLDSQLTTLERLGPRARVARVSLEGSFDMALPACVDAASNAAVYRARHVFSA